ncbi:MAG: RNA polymerase sigma factor [Bdellovibrionales bacterium]|nr:RNA polymerase sigma factor [Bdellovibrionales bacterium]
MISDDELVAKVGKGDQKAFATLFDRHSGRMLGYATRWLGGNKSVAEDIVQSAWLKIAQSASGYQSKNQFKSWALTIVRNLCMDEHRKSARQDDSWNMSDDDSGAGANFDTADAGPSVMDSLLLENEKARVQKALEALPEQQRVVLSAWMVEELSYEDLAANFRTTVPAVKSILFRARENMAKTLRGVR